VQGAQVVISSNLGGVSVTVNVNALRTAAPAGFKGHVEGDGVVVRMPTFVLRLKWV